MPQVQVRVSDEMMKTLDEWIKAGKYKSRSDAIRTVLAKHEEREKTREFYEMLIKRSKESKGHPEKLVFLE